MIKPQECTEKEITKRFREIELTKLENRIDNELKFSGQFFEGFCFGKYSQYHCNKVHIDGLFNKYAKIGWKLKYSKTNQYGSTIHHYELSLGESNGK